MSYGADAGGPRCGRHTVCQHIIELRPNYKYVSVGQLLRDAVELKMPEELNWSEVKQKMDAGELVDDVSETSSYLYFSIAENQ